jgi:hypothetical protein
MIDFSKTNQEILDSLNEVLNIPTGEKLRFNDIEKAFPDKGYLAMVAGAVLAAAKVDPEAQVVFNAASNGGADLSSKHAQEKVRAIAFAAKWPPELTAWILLRSTWTGPRWQHLGLPEPSLDWIQEQRKQFELQQAAIDKMREITETRNKWERVSQIIRSQIDSGLSASKVIEAVTVEWGT